MRHDMSNRAVAFRNKVVCPSHIMFRTWPSHCVVGCRLDAATSLGAAPERAHAGGAHARALHGAWVAAAATGSDARGAA
eukprot:6204599-Pleurochrysis_carterae.AAC.2